MFEVDRSIIIVRPTMAFYDWYISIPDTPKLTFAELREESHSYMVQKIEMIAPPSKLISDELAHGIFERELMLNGIDYPHWPKDRSKVEYFIEWFEIQVIPLVLDTLDSELKKWL